MATGPCPTAEEWAALRALPAEAQARLAAHVATCASCRKLHIDQATPLGGAALDGDTHTPLPDSTLPTLRPMPLPAPVRVGKYELQGLLGRGGMGAVHAALDPGLKRKVALKLLEGTDPELISRFMREAQAQARVDHRHLCKVYEVGEADGRRFIAMQLIAGKTLAQVAGELSIFEKVEVVRQAAEGLHAAHRLGLVHRDVKPGNVLMERGEDGRWVPYVTDFGLVRDLTTQGETVAGQLLGTPGFLSPEQARADDRHIDRRTDVYGLGATLFALLCDAPPFYAPDLATLLDQTLHAEAPSIRSKDPTLPIDLAAVVARCLEKSPADRYESARALADDLQRFLDGEPVRARPVGGLVRAARWAARHRAVTEAALVVAGSLAATAGVWWHGRATAAAQARAAQEFGQRVERLEGVMRHSHMLPLHDIGPEKAMVRAEMASLDGRARELGPEAAGAGHYAVGRGHLLLGEYGPARLALEQAWASGYRPPEAQAALGEALAHLYSEGLDGIGIGASPEQREQRTAALQRELRDPARAHLNGAAASAQTAAEAEYLRGQLAFIDDRPEEALAHAKQAQAQAQALPWFYEPALLELGVLRSQIRRGRETGQPELTRSALVRASAATGPLADIGRSDPAVLDVLCRVAIEQLTQDLRDDRPTAATFAEGDRVCSQGLVADPHVPAHLVHAVRFLKTFTDDEADHARVATALLQRQLALVDEALAQAPGDPEVLAMRGLVLGSLAIDERLRGLDPRPTLRRAIEAASAVAKVDQTTQRWLALFQAYRALALAEEHAGNVEAATLADEQAAAAAHRRIEVDPGASSSHFYFGLAQLELARRALRGGRDPGAAVALGRAAFERTLVINPSSYRSPLNLSRLEQVQEVHARLQGRLDPAWSGRALAQLDRAEALKPRDELVAYERAMTWLVAAEEQRGQPAAVGMLDQAMSFLSQARELDPADPDLDAAAGDIELERSTLPVSAAARLESARRAGGDFRTARAFVAKDPSQPWALAMSCRRQAELLTELGRPHAAELSDARRWLELSLKLNPRLPGALAEQAVLELLEARAERDPARQGARRRAVARPLQDALASDATLTFDYGPFLEESRR